MPYQVAAVSDFGGLDLASSPDQADCVDLLNVDFDKVGAVRQRDGYDNFTSPDADARLGALTPYQSGSTRHLIAVTQEASAPVDEVKVYNTAGAEVDTVNATFGLTPERGVQLGTPTDTVAYLPCNAAGIVSWNGSAFGSIPGVAALHLAVQSPDNRLVAVTGASKIDFSDEGDPETFDVANSVQVTPGDGEELLGLVSWRDYVFAFKETKFFVFYGNNTDAAGDTKFNHRPVDAGAGVGSRGCATASPHGVYFMSRRGIYLTTGDAPVLVSRAIDPIFLGGASSFYQAGVLNHAQIALCDLHWHDERLYFAFPAGSSTSNNRVAVFDPSVDWWAIWDIPAASLASFRVGNTKELVFSYASGNDNHIGRHSSAYTNDDGTAITSRYRTGFADLDHPAREKVIDSIRLWGTGTVAVSAARDFGALDTAENVTLGTAPAVAAGLAQGRKGELVSLQFASVSGGAWTLHRYAHLVSGVRSPGVRSA